MRVLSRMGAKQWVNLSISLLGRKSGKAGRACGGSDEGGSGKIKSTSMGEGKSITKLGTKTETKTGVEAYFECSEEGAGAMRSGCEEGGAGEGQEEKERLEEGQGDAFRL